MTRVLLLSSQVAHGHVGNSAMQFPLQRMGVDCLAVPSIVFSGRPDYPAVSRVDVAPDAVYSMVDALARNGWLAGLDAVISGYLPTAAHVHAVVRAIGMIRTICPEVTFICDPVIGDEPEGMYIDAEAAAAVRDALLPLAQIATPNRFELAWLSGRDIRTSLDARNAAARLGPRMVLATSSPSDNYLGLANILVTPDDAWIAAVNRRDSVPHGTGDFLAAVFAAHLVQGRAPAEALALATASMDALVSASIGFSELQIVGAQAVWVDPMPWAVQPMHMMAPVQPASGDAISATA